MKLIAYTRTKLADEVGEQDLVEQERGIAEYCKANQHELSGVLAEEGNQTDALDEALKADDIDGLIVTDPLVLLADIELIPELARKIVQHKKHVLMIYKNMHIPPSDDVHDTLMKTFVQLMPHGDYNTRH